MTGRGTGDPARQPLRLARWRCLPPALVMLLVMLGLEVLAPGRVQAAQVTVVLGDDSPPYHELAAALRTGLSTAGSGDPVVIASVPEFEAGHAGGDAADTLYVTVGLKAARSVHSARPRNRLLATLIPRESYESLFAGSGSEEGVRTVSAIWMDQPLARQLDLVRLALPSARRLGVLLGPRSAVQLPELERQARERELLVAAETVDASNGLVPALSRLLTRCDLLLALPDETVFNPGSAETILLMSYRKSVPLVAFSRAYAKAGALLALHSTPEQFGRQVAEIIAPVLQSAQRGLPPPQPPRYFQVTWNRAVAQSLQVPLRDEAELVQRLGGGGRP